MFRRETSEQVSAKTVFPVPNPPMSVTRGKGGWRGVSGDSRTATIRRNGRQVRPRRSVGHEDVAPSMFRRETSEQVSAKTVFPECRAKGKRLGGLTRTQSPLPQHAPDAGLEATKRKYAFASLFGMASKGSLKQTRVVVPAPTTVYVHTARGERDSAD
jgi:hypothetical protein